MENKKRILTCATDLFYAKGYDAVGVQEIVEKAGVTKPTLYYYFGSKYGLLQTIVEELSEQLLPALKQAAVYEGKIPETLLRIASMYIDFAVSNKTTYMLVMGLYYSAPENEAHQAVRPLMTSFYNSVVQVFEEAKAELGNMNDRQEQFAITFIGILGHFILRECEMQPGIVTVSEEAKRALVNQFMYGIFS